MFDLFLWALLLFLAFGWWTVSEEATGVSGLHVSRCRDVPNSANLPSVSGSAVPAVFRSLIVFIFVVGLPSLNSEILVLHRSGQEAAFCKLWVNSHQTPLPLKEVPVRHPVKGQRSFPPTCQRCRKLFLSPVRIQN